MRHLIAYFLMASAVSAQTISNADLKLTLFDFRSAPPQPARLHFGEKFAMTATCRNEGTNTYCVFWEPRYEGKRVNNSFSSGGTWCPPGGARVYYYVGHDATVRVDEIHYFAYGKDDRGDITYKPQYELGSIPVDYAFSEPRPDVEPNPLFAGVSRVGMHPDLPGFKELEAALLDIGLKQPTYSACPTTEPIILIGSGVPVEAAQAVIRICVDHLKVPLRDIQLDYVSEQDRDYREIYIGVRNRPRYDEYPAAKLAEVLEPGISLEEFQERLERNEPGNDDGPSR